MATVSLMNSGRFRQYFPWIYSFSCRIVTIVAKRQAAQARLYGETLYAVIYRRSLITSTVRPCNRQPCCLTKRSGVLFPRKRWYQSIYIGKSPVNNIKAVTITFESSRKVLWTESLTINLNEVNLRVKKRKLYELLVESGTVANCYRFRDLFASALYVA